MCNVSTCTKHMDQGVRGAACLPSQVPKWMQHFTEEKLVKEKSWLWQGCSSVYFCLDGVMSTMCTWGCSAAMKAHSLSPDFSALSLCTQHLYHRLSALSSLHVFHTFPTESKAQLSLCDLSEAVPDMETQLDFSESLAADALGCALLKCMPKQQKHRCSTPEAICMAADWHFCTS